MSNYTNKLKKIIALTVLVF